VVSPNVLRIHEPENLKAPEEQAATRLGLQGCPPGTLSRKSSGGPSSRQTAMREYGVGILILSSSQ